MTGDSEFESGSDEIQLVTVFVTGRIIEYDMAVDVLKQARIPFQSQEETGTGMKLAMPVAPTPGPGTFWSLLVPEKALADARQALSQLPFPITTNPGPWDFLPPQGREEERADVRAQRWILSIGFLFVPVCLIAIGLAMIALGGDRRDAMGAIAAGVVIVSIIGAIIVHSRRWLAKHPDRGKSKVHRRH
jgi:hypothetical protein